MRKLRLDLDNITVDSFHVTPEDPDARGTVLAHSHASCPQCYPSSMSEPTGCGTCAHVTVCYGTCDASCNSCVNSCGCPRTYEITACEYTCCSDPC
jgi:hypothetical protein